MTSRTLFLAIKFTRVSRVVLSAVLSGCVAIPGAAQSASSDRTDSYTLHTGTHIVVLDVVVTDRRGHSVAGLPQSAFSLLENGRPQLISHFEEHAPTNSGVIEAQTSSVLSALPVNTFATYEPLASNSLNVILLNEALPLPPYDVDPLYQRLVGLIKSAPAETPFAVYRLNTELRLVQTATASRERLLEVAKQLWNNLHITPDEFPTVASIAAHRAIFTTGMEQLIAGLQSVPGHRTVFAFTGGLQCSIVAADDRHFPCGTPPFVADNYLCSVMDRMEQARTSIYRYYPDGQIVYGLGCRSEKSDLPHLFDTGLHYYTLYYTSADPHLDGKFRTFKVELTDSHLKPSYRAGYFARPEDTSSGFYTSPPLPAIAPADGPVILATPSEAEDAATVISPMPIAFTVHVVPASLPGGGPQNRPPRPLKPANEKLRLQGYRDFAFDISVAASQLRFTRTVRDRAAGSEGLSALLQVTARSLIGGETADGRVAQFSARTDSQAVPGTATSAIKASMSIEVPDRATSLQIRVCDIYGNRCGLLDIPAANVSLTESP